MNVNRSLFVYLLSAEKRWMRGDVLSLHTSVGLSLFLFSFFLLLLNSRSSTYMTSRRQRPTTTGFSSLVFSSYVKRKTREEKKKEKRRRTLMNNILLLLDWSNVPLILSSDRHSAHDKVPTAVLWISTKEEKKRRIGKQMQEEGRSSVILNI